MSMGWSAAHAVKNPSVASASTQQSQANLRVGETCDGREQRLGPTATLQGMVLHESLVTDGGAQQFAVTTDAALAIGRPQEFMRQVGLQCGRVSAPDNDGLTLAEVELESQFSSTPLRVSNRGANHRNRASQNPVVKEEGGKVGGSCAELKSQRLQGSSKQQGPERVALLDTTSGGKDVVAELQVGSTQARVAWMAFSAPAGTATPTCAGQKKSRAPSRTASRRHFPVKRRRSSPTAIGRSPPFGLGTATRRAPARKGATALQASPRASKLTKAVSCSTSPVDDPGRQASSKCWTRKPRRRVFRKSLQAT